MSAWILPVSHIDAIVTTAVKGFKASDDAKSRTLRDGEWVTSYHADDTLGWDGWIGGAGLITADEATAVGRMLIAANARSVDARYGERNRRQSYFYRGTGRILTLGQLAQAIGSLDYQSCEVDSWYTSKARKWLDKVERAIYVNIPRENIPGYDGECHVIEREREAS